MKKFRDYKCEECGKIEERYCDLSEEQYCSCSGRMRSIPSAVGIIRGNFYSRKPSMRKRAG